jgi:hypothetical protein
MFNRYEIYFDGEKIGDANSFNKSMDIATEILDTIKKYPKEEDEYQLLQIRCYHWLDRIFSPKKYTLVNWSEVKQMFVINRM